MKKFIFVAGMIMAYGSVGFANQVENPGFEVEGSEEKFAMHWEDNAKGGCWGSARRTDWQQRSGTHAAAVQGSFCGADYGGWWQDCPVQGGSRYELSAYFFWDNGWKADSLEYRIEWYADGVKISEDKKQVGKIPESRWTEKIMTAMAPKEADSAHVVLDASGLDVEGVLYMDDISFEQK